jgi:hypothetical protein
MLLVLSTAAILAITVPLVLLVHVRQVKLMIVTKQNSTHKF